MPDTGGGQWAGVVLSCGSTPLGTLSLNIPYILVFFVSKWLRHMGVRNFGGSEAKLCCAVIDSVTGQLVVAKSPDDHSGMETGSASLGAVGRVLSTGWRGVRRLFRAKRRAHVTVVPWKLEV